jgi:hypothetical protein
MRRKGEVEVWYKLGAHVLVIDYCAKKQYIDFA